MRSVLILFLQSAELQRTNSVIYEHYGEKFPDDSQLNIRSVGAAHDRAFIAGEPWLLAFSRDGRTVRYRHDCDDPRQT